MAAFIPSKRNLPDNPNRTVETNPGTGTGENPQTGDISNLLLWVMLLAVSGCGAACTAVYNRRKKLR